MTISELDILEPKDPSIENWDDWPTYSLRKTSIISQKTGEPISLLKAHRDHAVKITGVLETIDSDLAHLIRDQKYRNKAIELVDVVFYAFAEFHDGSCGFWAAGKAGWFEIKEPAAASQQSYRMMKEAASMFYFLADKLRTNGGFHYNLATKPVETYSKKIFREYVSHGKNLLRRANEYEVRKGFETHSDFLITSMLEGQEGLDWLRSPMFYYFKRNFPEQKQISEIEARLHRPEVPKMKADPSEAKQIPKEKTTARSGTKRKRDLELRPDHSVKPDSGSDQDTATSGETNEIVGNERGTFQKRKSILQPSGSKFSKKAAGRRRSLPPIDLQVTEQDVEEDSADSKQVERESPPLPPVDRKQMGLHRRGSHPMAETSPATYHDYLPKKYVDVKLVEHNLPSCRPDGPDDIWTCPFDTCVHKVREASSTAGNTSIKDHFQMHAREAQEKIDLVYKESRPYLPVDNLVRRLQSYVPRPDMFPGSPPSTSGRPVAIRSLY